MIDIFYINYYFSKKMTFQMYSEIADHFDNL